MAGKKQVNLTEGQKQCLRLVDRHCTSKEIARELGISPFTVDQRLDSARRKLNADSRRSAAKIFVTTEAGKVSDTLVYETSNIARQTVSANPLAQINDRGQSSNHNEIAFDTPFLTQRPAWTNQTLFTIPPIGGSGHDLTKTQVLSEIIKTSTISAVSIAAAVMIIIGVMRILA